MRFFLLLTLICFVAGAASRGATAQSVPPEPAIAEVYAEGRALLLLMRLDEADRAYARLLRHPQTRADGYYYLGKSHLIRALLSEEETYYEQFFAYADSLIEALGSQPETAWNRHLQAEAHFQRAFALANQGSYMRAALAARRAHGVYHRNVRDNPDFIDSYRGRGIFRVIVGSVPGSYRWLLNLLGFGGTVSQGMEDLQLAAQKAEHGREEAEIVFSVIDIMINEARMGGLDRLVRLYERNRSSPIIAHVYAFALLHERQAVKAEQVLRPFVDRPDPRHFFVVQNYYFLGESLFRQNKFEDAADYFERFISSYNGKALQANAHLKRGLSLEMLGRYEQARNYYGRVQSSRDFDGDKFAKRWAAARLERPMTGVERSMVLGMNAQDGGRYEVALEKLRPILDDASAPAVLRAEASYRIGRSLQGLERAGEALYYFQWAVENPGDRTARWGPWSQYYVGVIYAEMGLAAQARKAFENVLSYRGNYDFSQALEQRTRAAMSRL